MTKPLYNVFVGSRVIQSVTVTTKGDRVILKGVGNREWFERDFPKAAITRKFRIPS